MLVKSLVSKLAKYGLEPQLQPHSTIKYYVAVNGKVLTWIDQDGLATCTKVAREGERDDAMTDYFVGYYARTIKEAISGLELPANPKDYTPAVEPESEVVEATVEPAESVESDIPVEAQDIAQERRERLAERQEYRADRYSELADKNRKAATAAYAESRQLSSVIPFGQPVLVGHHSERTDRNHRDKMWNKMGQGVALESKAQHYEEKLDSLNTNRAISSDDPDAIKKLKAKLACLEESQARMKAVNATIRKLQKQGLTGEAATTALMAQTGMNHDDAHSLLNPKWGGQRVGYQGYELTNNNATIRNTKQRIQELQRQWETVAQDGGNREQAYPELGLTVVHNHTINRLQLKFDGKPEANVRSILKGRGFKWSRLETAWQRQLNRAAEMAAASVIDQLK